MKFIFNPLFFALSLAAFVAQAEPVQVLMQTNQGDFTLELYPEKAPQTVENFLQYVDDGFYHNTVFHRVIPKFMVQGGGFTPEMSKKDTRAPVQNEADNGLKNARGTVAMARTPDPHSATAQFFINHKDNAFLDHPGQDGWGYCVFGKVIDGMETVDAIAAVPTGIVRGKRDVPKEAVVIEKAVRVQPETAAEESAKTETEAE